MATVWLARLPAVAFEPTNDSVGAAAPTDGANAMTLASRAAITAIVVNDRKRLRTFILKLPSTRSNGISAHLGVGAR